MSTVSWTSIPRTARRVLRLEELKDSEGRREKLKHEPAETAESKPRREPAEAEGREGELRTQAAKTLDQRIAFDSRDEQEGLHPQDHKTIEELQQHRRKLLGGTGPGRRRRLPADHRQPVPRRSPRTRSRPSRSTSTPPPTPTSAASSTRTRCPPHDAVRIEELLNYFPYNDPPPTGDDPFSVNVEVAGCPWNAEHRLVRIGLKGEPIDSDKRPPSNLVFLIDVSGSMDEPEQAAAAQGRRCSCWSSSSARTTGWRSSSTPGPRAWCCPRPPASQKAEILSALEQLQAGGSTNGGAGIQLAYDMAVQNFIKGGTNRVILATDGDFNVGVTDRDRARQADRGEGQERRLPQRARLRHGQPQGRHAREARRQGERPLRLHRHASRRPSKVLVEEMGATLVTIAKDVKIQVEFNPAKVAAYRLIGYENRMLQAQDFDDDTKDAGEIGAGHHVTALYEIVPAGQGARPSDLGQGREAAGRRTAQRRAAVQGARRRRQQADHVPRHRRRPRLLGRLGRLQVRRAASPASGCCSATRPTREA